MINAIPFGTGNILGPLTINKSAAGEFVGGTFRGPRFDVVGTGSVSQIQFLFTNFSSVSGSDSGGPCPLNIACTVEVGTVDAGDQTNDAKYPLTFQGQLFRRIDPRWFVLSDPININLLPGQFVWPRTFVSVDSDGFGFPVSFESSSAYGEGWDIAGTEPVPDKRDSGTITLQTSQSLYGPSLAIGRRSGTPMPVIGIFGDSIITGSVDSGAANVRYTYRLGWAMRGLNARAPVIQTCKGGISAANFRNLRNIYMHYCDHVIVALGTNDESNTAAFTEGKLLTWYQQFKTMGAKVWGCTIPPKSTSTDGWTTTGNQTPTSFDSKRVAMNDWLRGGAPIDGSGNPVAVGTPGAVVMGAAAHPMWNFLEVADMVETSRNSGIWRANFTADGIHPNQAGHIAASAVLSDLSPFGY